MAKKKSKHLKQNRRRASQPLGDNPFAFMEGPYPKIRQPRGAKKTKKAKRATKRGATGRESQPRDDEANQAALERYRQLLWHVGSARQPRAAIVGGALALRNAVSEITAAPANDICHTIFTTGHLHLREDVRSTYFDLNNQRRRSAKRDLLDHLSPAIAVLRDLGLVRITEDHRVYLVGDGPRLFHQWPDLSRPDSEPEPVIAPRRRRRRAVGYRQRLDATMYQIVVHDSGRRAQPATPAPNPPSPPLPNPHERGRRRIMRPD
jgi:hypothetical protein